MYITVKYTNNTRCFAEGETGVEDKKRYGSIQHAPYSLNLAPFDFTFFPQLKSDLHGKRFRALGELRRESDLKIRYRLVIFMENGFNDTGNGHTTRESILRNCAILRIDDVIFL